VHLAKTMERQLERKHSYKKTYHYDSSNGKVKSKKEGSSPPKQQSSKSQSHKHDPNPSTSSTSRSSSIKCLGKGHISRNLSHDRTTKENKIGAF